ncbi:MAG TPA: hypothetical protein VNT25_04015 [Allosphingosinicella sp.]|jgi:hypothetical protein|nr:hypothetical protein [Allosphingosinicella sp.]
MTISAAPLAGVLTPSRPDLIQEEQGLSVSRRMSDLLRRYPNIPDADRLELADFLKRGNPVEIADATGNGLEPRAMAFRTDHPEHFGRGFRTWLPWLGGWFALAALLLLAPQLI